MKKTYKTPQFESVDTYVEEIILASGGFENTEEIEGEDFGD